jgi:hypothetical protein
VRAGRLNDEPIVLSRGPERIPQTSDFFTEEEGGITKATSPCVIGAGKASFLVSFGGTRAVGQEIRTPTSPSYVTSGCAPTGGPALRTPVSGLWSHGMGQMQCTIRANPRSGEARAGCSGRGLRASDRGRANVGEPRF